MQQPSEYQPHPGGYGNPPPPQGNTVRRGATGEFALRVIQFIWVITGLAVVALALDFIFHLGRAANAGFGAFIYTVADPMAAPFDNVFGQTAVKGAYIARWGDLLAIVVYAVVAWAVCRLIAIAAAPRGAVPPAV